MPDCLILTKKETEARALETFAKSFNLRTKTCDSTEMCRQWLKSRQFDVLILPEKTEESELRQISTLLWSTNSNAECIAYSMLDLDHRSAAKKRWALSLMGIEYVGGEKIFDDLKVILKRVNDRVARTGENFRVLVVEDLDAPRDIICSFIEHLEYCVVTGVADGKTALNMLKDDPARFACVVTDVNMPEMTGYELTDEIRRDPTIAHIPVIVLTAYGTSDHLIKCLSAGATGFLVKPPTKEHMSRELSRAKRIYLSRSSPRLVSPEDLDMMKTILEERGIF